MTSERAVETGEALTAEEEAKFRESVRLLAPVSEGLQWANSAVMSLLATLDAVRLAVARGEPEIDVERLAAALDSVDLDEFDTLGAFDSTGYATAILAALPTEPQPPIDAVGPCMNCNGTGFYMLDGARRPCSWVHVPAVTEPAPDWNTRAEHDRQSSAGTHLFDEACPWCRAATEPADGLPETAEMPTVCVVCGIPLPDDAAAREHLGTALVNERLKENRQRPQDEDPLP